MPSLAIEIMEQHKAALLRQEQEQMAAMSRRWLQMESELNDHVELFVRRVQMDGLTPSQLQSRQFQLDRYRSLLNQTRQQLDLYSDYAEPLITQRQGEVGRASIRAANATIEATGADNGVRIAFDRLPVEAIENMVGLAGDGSPLRSLLEDSYGAGADAMLNQLIGATTRGQNPQATARAMVRNGLSQSLSRMMNVARTEQLRVGREATRQAYQSSGVVEEMRRLATKDRRACIACLMADGETMPLDESLREHPQGRCSTIPVVTGMPLVEWEKGKDWFIKQSPNTQRDILGTGKYEAWQDDQIYLEQFVTVRKNATWGDSLKPASLKSMLDDYEPFEVRQPDPNREIATPTDEPEQQLLTEESEGELLTQVEGLTERIRAAEEAGDDALDEQLTAERKSYLDEIARRHSAGTWRGESGSEAVDRRARASEIAFLQTEEGQRQVEADRRAVEEAAQSVELYQPSDDTLRAVRAYIDEQTEAILPRLRPRIKEPDLTSEEYKRVAHEQLRALVKDRPVAIQFKSQHLDSFLETGRYRTQFETGTTGGTLDVKGRTAAEGTGIGYPDDIDPKLRPVYGYLDFEADSFGGGVGSYGDITFVMRNDVRRRSTVTVGDSLYAMQENQLAATPLDDPSIESMDTLVTPLYRYAKRRDVDSLISDVGYIEIQIQGGVRVEDVAFIRDPRRKLSADKIADLEERGIKVIQAIEGEPE